MNDPFLPPPRNGGNCIFTICTRSYIGLANALGASIHAQQIDADFVIVVVDADAPEEAGPYGRMISAKDLCFYGREAWSERTFRYDLVELCTSIKPRCFRSLLGSGYDKIVYLDPDIIVFNKLDGIFSGLDEYDVVVTPHRLSRDHDNPFRGGVFNLGFLGTRRGPATDRVMEWWEKRLERHCLNDPVRGFFTDQKWMDQLPVLFRDGGLLICGDPGMNLAPWNFDERNVARSGDRWFAALKDTARDEGESAAELGFVHFSGFDYRLLAEGKDDAQSVRAIAIMPEFSEIADILKRYLQQTRHLDHAAIAYGYSSFSDGRMIHPGHRRIFHRLAGSGQRFADPFDAAGPFYRLLRRNGLLVSRAQESRRQPRAAELGGEIRRAAAVFDLFSRIGVRVLGYPRFFQLSKLLVRYFYTSNHARWTRPEGKNLDLDSF